MNSRVTAPPLAVGAMQAPRRARRSKVSSSLRYSQLASVGISEKIRSNQAFFIARSGSLGIFGISLLLQEGVAMTSIITWGVPTMLTVFSFSLFTYYIATLNIQIERSNSDRSTYDVEASRLSITRATRSLASQGGRKQSAFEQTSYTRQRMSLIKPLFILFNLFAGAAFVIIVISCRKNPNKFYLDYNGLQNDVKQNSQWWKEPTVIDFYQAIKGLTGLVFIVLGITILNYGTKLETAISQQT